MDKKRKLWNEEGRQQLNALPLDRWAAVRRHDLTSLLVDSRQAARMPQAEGISRLRCAYFGLSTSLSVVCACTAPLENHSGK